MRNAAHDGWTVTLIRLIVSASLGLMTFSVMAERPSVWSRQYVVSVPFNEMTSKASARSMAMERARGMAANEFGSGVLTEEELKDGKLRETDASGDGGRHKAEGDVRVVPGGRARCGFRGVPH